MYLFFCFSPTKTSWPDKLPLLPGMCTFTTGIFCMYPGYRLKFESLGWIALSVVFSLLIDLICVRTCVLSSAPLMVWLCQSELSSASLIDCPKWISPGAEWLFPLCYICISRYYCSDSTERCSSVLGFCYRPWWVSIYINGPIWLDKSLLSLACSLEWWILDHSLCLRGF